MANLVPVQFDKDTGRIVLSHDGTSGGGGSLPPGCLSICGYMHPQDAAASVWNVNHGRNTLFFVTQIFDIDGFQIQPDEVVAVDPNNIRVEFQSDVAGRAHIMLFV